MARLVMISMFDERILLFIDFSEARVSFPLAARFDSANGSWICASLEHTTWNT